MCFRKVCASRRASGDSKREVSPPASQPAMETNSAQVQLYISHLRFIKVPLPVLGNLRCVAAEIEYIPPYLKQTRNKFICTFEVYLQKEFETLNLQFNPSPSLLTHPQTYICIRYLQQDRIPVRFQASPTHIVKMCHQNKKKSQQNKPPPPPPKLTQHS